MNTANENLGALCGGPKQPGLTTVSAERRFGVVVIRNVPARGGGQCGPFVEWGTYLGGSGDEEGYGSAVDSIGNMYATGYTYFSGRVSGGRDMSYNGHQDGYVVKIVDPPVAPTVTITSTAPDPANASPIPMVVTFNEREQS